MLSYVLLRNIKTKKKLSIASPRDLVILYLGRSGNPWSFVQKLPQIFGFQQRYMSCFSNLIGVADRIHISISACVCLWGEDNRNDTPDK